jgi:hypothetical protein
MLDIWRLLIERGADVNLMNSNGKNAVCMLLERETVTDEECDLVLPKANVHLRSNNNDYQCTQATFNLLDLIIVSSRRAFFLGAELIFDIRPQTGLRFILQVETVTSTP